MCRQTGIVVWVHNPLKSNNAQIRHVAKAIIDDMDEYVLSRVSSDDEILDLAFELVYIGRHHTRYGLEGNHYPVVEWTFGSNHEDGLECLVYQEESVLGPGRWLIRTPFIGDRPITFDHAMKIAVDFHNIFVANGYL